MEKIKTYLFSMADTQIYKIILVLLNLMFFMGGYYDFNSYLILTVIILMFLPNQTPQNLESKKSVISIPFLDKQIKEDLDDENNDCEECFQRAEDLNIDPQKICQDCFEEKQKNEEPKVLKYDRQYVDNIKSWSAYDDNRCLVNFYTGENYVYDLTFYEMDNKMKKHIDLEI
jgi:hypothetical protein